MESGGRRRSGTGTAAFVHVACCGGLLLVTVVASGALGGAGAWFLGGGWALTGAAIVLILAGRHLWRQLSRRDSAIDEQQDRADRGGSRDRQTAVPSGSSSAAEIRVAERLGGKHEG